MYDPDLYLFINDDGILARNDVRRVVHSLRRDSTDPVLEATEDEGPKFGWSTVVRDPETGQFKIWYCTLGKRVEWRFAVSDDALTWTRCGSAFKPGHQYWMDGFSVTSVGPDVAPWFQGAKFVGAAMLNEVPKPGEPTGIYAARSLDGRQFEVRFPSILPHKGDRLYLGYDQVEGEYMFITRPYYGIIPGFPPIRMVEVVDHRMARLWKSRDLVTWEDHGIILRADDYDPPHTQIHGMECFRYGQGFLALVEIMPPAWRVQLAYSADGIHWERVGKRETILPRGGEGSWDSGWAVPTSNPPIPSGERLLVPYVGDSHSGRRAIGLASIRKDGCVSLESTRREGGTVVTQKLPLTRHMRLELNVNCGLGGHVTSEVIAAAPGKYFEPVPGYEAQPSRMKGVDSVCRQVNWGDRQLVEPIPEQSCFLRFTLNGASLFSYRWSVAK